MYMVGIAPNFYGLAFHIVADATQVTMQFRFIRWYYHWCTMLCAEH